MHKRLIVLTVVCLLAFVASKQHHNSSATYAQGQTRLVLAHYYAWFSPDSFNNGKTPYTNPAPYFSTDGGTIQRHVSQAQGIGIDGFVQAWYGPDASQQTEPNFAALLNVASGSGFKAAVSFEPISAFMPNNDVRAQSLATLLATHANHPAYLRMDGKPVIFFWANWALTPGDWDYIRSIADPGRNSIWIAEGGNMQYLSAFDGMYIYNLAWSPDPAGINLRWGGETRAASATYGGYKYWIGTAMPGFNDSLLGRGGNTIVRDRGGGSYLQASFSGAAQSGADMIVINSFNEWPEGSHIEPSAEFGDTYLNLTRDLISTYKGGGIPASVPVVSSAPTAETTTNTNENEGSETAPVVVQQETTPLPTNTPFPTYTPTPLPTPLPDGRYVYYVQQGDSLITIGIDYDLTLDEIYAYNNLQSDSLLSIGQEITVGFDNEIVNATATAVAQLDPTITPTPSYLDGYPNTTVREQDGAIIYTVLDGNTLIEIALFYDLTIPGIYELNGMDETSVLSVGQGIVVGYLPQPEADAVGGSADLPLDSPTGTPVATATATATVTPMPPTATAIPTIVSELATVDPGENSDQATGGDESDLEEAAANSGLTTTNFFLAILLTVVGMLGLAGALLIYLGRKA